MDQSTVERLLRVNRQFYDRFGEAFAATRGRRQPGLQRLLPYLPTAGRLLDVGCGNGRLARLLDDDGRALDYLGVDSSPRLLEIARQGTAALSSVGASFQYIDITIPGWSSALPAASFHAVLLLGVLHHLPGFALRRDVLAALRPLLADGAVVAVSTWQFLNEARLRGKIVPWGEAGLHLPEVDPGDYLLDWRRGGRGLRYCHLVDESELAALARATGFFLADLYFADGRTGKLNLFGVLRPTF